MSLFLLQIQDEFENQKFSNDNNGLYYDETFRFNKNDIRENYRYNCFISQDDNKNIKFYEVTFNTEFKSHVKEWRNKSYDHPDFKRDETLKMPLNIMFGMEEKIQNMNGKLIGKIF